MAKKAGGATVTATPGGKVKVAKRSKVTKRSKAVKNLLTASLSGKGRRKWLKKMAQESGDPRQRLWALTQLDADSAKSADTSEMKLTGVSAAIIKVPGKLRDRVMGRRLADPDPRRRLEAQFRERGADLDELG